MSKLVQADTWVWVVVEDPEKNEKFLGQEDRQAKVAFIPTFLEKEAALKCMNLFDRRSGAKYEAQAILFEELRKDARSNDFMLYLLDGDGRILEKVAP